MLIRKASMNDLSTIIKWSVEFVEQVLPEAKADKELDCMWNGVLLVAEENGELKGMIAGCYVQHPLSPELSVLQEIAWWVPKEYRKSSIGLSLLSAFSDIKETDLSVMSLLPSSEVAEKHVTELGFEKSEVAYTRRNK
jgi:N-acetylglutamate synthase-like GNAT family acetyltransferase